MTDRALILRVDAAAGAAPGAPAEDRAEDRAENDAGGMVRLLRDESEYRRALARAATLPAFRSLPDEAIFHLYACELLERMRERIARTIVPDAGAGGAETWILPFWPTSLFAAHGITAHAAAEIEAMFPVASVAYARCSPAALRTESVRVLGSERLDVAAYGRAVERAAKDDGWRLEPTMGDAGPGDA